VLIGGAVFPLMGALYYWFPKITGRMMSEHLGRWNFWLFFIGFHLTFFPMHQPGLAGMPRRVYTYLPETGWGSLNLIATAGALILATSVLLFLSNAFWSLRSGAPASANPWGADTLEWGIASPAPVYNYAYLPTVSSRTPLWENEPDQPVVRGMRADILEVLVTTLLDATPDHRHLLDGPSYWPVLTALAVGIGIITAIFTPWGVVIGALLSAITLTGWFWPHGEPIQDTSRESGQTFEEAA
jgi:cytochrome c oxidase subunit I+III